MKCIRFLLLLALLLCFRGNDLVQPTSFTVLNKCNSTVWPGVLSTSGNLGSTGFVLGAGGTQNLKAPQGWSGRFWARTGCMFDGSGRGGNCTTGDCGDQIECSGSLSPPATIAEFTLDAYNGQDFYDVSLLDGFNLPLLVEPKGGNSSCAATGCTANLNSVCPVELKPGDGEGCLTACEKFGKPEYCCTGAFQTRDTCQPSDYSKMFKSACPKAYSYAFDDDTSTFTCSGANYTITFCPDSVPKSVQGNVTSFVYHGSPPIESPAPQEGPSFDSASGHSNENKGKMLAIVLSLVSAMLLLACMGCFLWIRRKKKTMRNATIFLKDKSNEKTREDQLQLPSFDFATIAAATDHFSDGNKLGEGGFGPVYKGKLGEDQEIAVKRLAKTSQQGASEFKNEVMLIAKLQHRNLVRLLGCCIQGEERMLIYEYMVNKSLDAFIFDAEKAALLDWKTRYHIIMGITHGLLYLHHDSRFRIIHRDLKASNILLDKDMNPKISDFGMARIFGGDETDFNTRKVVGTYGYMAPEYALDGNFSMKSDIFSFGVLVLEIISGKKNRGIYAHSPHLNLVAHAWSLWNEGKSSVLVDESVSHSVVMDEAVKCIKIGLLCVQEHAEDRPLMKTVIQMFGSDISSLPQPKKPGFIARMEPLELIDPYSVKLTSNEVTITSLEGRWVVFLASMPPKRFCC